MVFSFAYLTNLYLRSFKNRNVILLNGVRGAVTYLVIINCLK